MSYRAYSIIFVRNKKSGRNDEIKVKRVALMLQFCEDFGINNGFSVSFCSFLGLVQE